MPNLADTINAATSYLAPKDIEVIIYHHPCPDGAAGACAGWLVLTNENTTYIPYLRENLNDGRGPYDEALLASKNVLFIDCAPSLTELQNNRRLAKKIMVLDHHVSAAQELVGQDGCFFVMENSGAVLAWHYFHGLEEALPLLYDLIQDRDLLLWKKREQSVALDTAISKLNPNFDFKFFLPYLTEYKLLQLIAIGQELIVQEHLTVEHLAQIAEFRTYMCPATNKTYNIKCVELKDYSLTLQVSEILRLQENVDFCMSWYLEGDNIYRVSMRTAKPKAEVDLSIISKHFGEDKLISGGGHANKAGCRVAGLPSNYLQPKKHITKPIYMKLTKA